MRQRNAGAYPLTVMTNPPQEVLPGEEIDCDEKLAGFEPVAPSDNEDDDKPANGDKTDAGADAPTKTTRKRAAAAAASTEEV